jgi:AAT family amino acid transporter
MKPDEVKKLKYRLPLYPFTSYLSLGFLALVVGLMAFFPDTRIALIVGPAWILLLVAVYFGKGFNKKNDKTVSQHKIS